MPCCNIHSLAECSDEALSLSTDSGHYPIALNKNFATEAAKPSYAPHSRILPVHIRISLQSTEDDLKASRVPAAVSVTVRGHSGASGSVAKVDRVLRLNAVDLTINAVTGVDSWDHDGKILELHWAKGFDGEKVVDIDYVIEKPIAGLYFHVPNEVVPDRALHVITDHETERARYWLPCVDVPLVRTTLEFVITHSTHHTAVANGAHISTTPNADNAAVSTTIYKLANHTCPSYLICWAVGDFVTVDDGEVDGMKLQYLCSRDNEFVTPENLLKTFGKTGAMVRWMQNKLGFKFPWEKYYQIVSPKIEGGAMENISLVTYKDVFLTNDNLSKDGWGTTVDNVNVHEMAHTYFGDLITMRHFEHVWLKESWATYMAYMWSEDHYSHEDARYEIFTEMEGYMQEATSYVRPIVCRTYNSSWDMFDSHTYPGGSFRLHMLRWVVGSDTFWAGVKNYIKKYAGTFVETEDFKRELELESGLNLTKFFDQWIYGRGHVKLKADYEFNADRKLVQITLEQTQVNKDLEIPLVFDVTIEVDVIDVDGKVHTAEVVFNDATGPKVVAFIPLGAAKPDAVEIDPRGKVLHSLEFNPGEAILEGTAKRGRDIMSRIRAYRQLIKNGGVSAMKKVAAALPDEPFYGVRCAVYTSLSNSDLQSAVDVIANSLATERDPKALRVLVNAATAKDAGIREGLLSVLSTKADLLSPRSRRFLYTNLGRQKHAEDASLLIAAWNDPASRDLHSHTYQGILAGLGLHRSEAAFEHLHSLLFGAVRRAMPEPCHVVAVDAYASAAVWLENALHRKEAAERLAHLVRADGSHRVQKAAIRALAKFGDEKKPHLRVCAAVAATAFAEQDTEKLVAFVKGLSGGGAGDAAGLKKTVEDLETKLKKVEQTLLLMEAKMESGLFAKSDK
ncbi:hypothetical protein CcCBS67573_g05043 [Chytriomyces confervae]|uniref:Uncharacterized protein n=1 Tax=Chytriomyces confervae TaxID=246404 RepID=A0A507FDP4_9FUNG|nr:hypothetical protein HDU80_006631 [Chytriomyces hyalinus]TPX73697.1 hypothetical protein CcCBS67573_g05043 [Chytriomyces confervae]